MSPLLSRMKSDTFVLAMAEVYDILKYYMGHDVFFSFIIMIVSYSG